MQSKGKNVPRLRQISNIERATSKKARESWQMFTIMAEFIESAERLSELRPAVSIFGSARTRPDDPYYERCMEIARRLSDEGFAVISGGVEDLDLMQVIDEPANVVDAIFAFYEAREIVLTERDTQA